jgi:hypothetical protein
MSETGVQYIFFWFELVSLMNAYKLRDITSIYVLCFYCNYVFVRTAMDVLRLRHGVQYVFFCLISNIIYGLCLKNNT